MNKTQFNAKLQEFVAAFKSGQENMLRCGEILVELVSAFPSAYDDVLAVCPLMDRHMLARLERLGRKTLHINLLYADAPGLKALSHLPYSQQELYLTRSVELVVHTGNGTEILNTKAVNLTKEQAKQVFTRSAVRTIPEQKAWLVQEQAKFHKGRGILPPAWQVTKDGKLEVLSHTKFTAAELRKILKQLKG